LADGTAVAARQGHLLATSFHPELTGDARFHQLFVKMAQGADAAVPSAQT
jgi:5'-phosphate synthase pdxT subunit